MDEKELLKTIEEAARDGRTEVRLNDKGIKSLPPEIRKLVNLRELYLYDNRLRSLPAEMGELSLFDRIALESGQQITGPSQYVSRLRNSLIIAGLSTFASVGLALFAGYAFSRYQVSHYLCT